MPREFRTLNLEDLQIVARDEKTTLMRFSCNQGSIRIKHLIPFATPPYVGDIASPDVRFRATHAITIMCDDVHYLYHVAQPQYHFADVETRRKFQELVRGRCFVDEFEAMEVTELQESGHVVTDGSIRSGSSGGSTSKKTKNKSKNLNQFPLAQSEPIQIWRWDRPGSGWRVPSVVTMTFLSDTGGEWRFKEWHAQDLEGKVKVTQLEGRSKTIVEMCWAIPRIQGAQRVRIMFKSKRGELFPCPHLWVRNRMIE